VNFRSGLALISTILNASLCLCVCNNLVCARIFWESLCQTGSTIRTVRTPLLTTTDKMPRARSLFCVDVIMLRRRQTTTTTSSMPIVRINFMPSFLYMRVSVYPFDWYNGTDGFRSCSTSPGVRYLCEYFREMSHNKTFMGPYGRKSSVGL